MSTAIIGCDAVARDGFEVIAYVLKSNGIPGSIGISAGQGAEADAWRGLLPFSAMLPCILRGAAIDSCCSSEKGAPNP